MRRTTLFVSLIALSFALGCAPDSGRNSGWLFVLESDTPIPLASSSTLDMSQVRERLQERLRLARISGVTVTLAKPETQSRFVLRLPAGADTAATLSLVRARGNFEISLVATKDEVREAVASADAYLASRGERPAAAPDSGALGPGPLGSRMRVTDEAVWVDVARVPDVERLLAEANAAFANGPSRRWRWCVLGTELESPLFLLDQPALLVGDDFERANPIAGVEPSAPAAWGIEARLRAPSPQSPRALPASTVGRLLAVSVDETVLFTLLVAERITDRSLVLANPAMDRRAALRLAALINTGEIPAPLHVVSRKRTGS